MEDLEAGVLEYEIIGEFLDVIRKEFGGRRRRIKEGSRVEGVGTGREDNRRVCLGV